MAIAGHGRVRVEPSTALPTDAEIRAQLDRIRLSAEFDAPDRARKFLAYVVEETVAGRSDRIKAYSIATEVFGRDSSFDAQTDPAVRIEAGRIRRALERYYLVAGRDDSIVIKIPKGAYVPTFERHVDAHTETSLRSSAFAGPISSIEPSRQPWMRVGIAAIAFALGGLAAYALLQPGTTGNGSNTARVRPNIPTLVVLPFEDLSATPQSAMITRGLADEVVDKIARFKEIVVVTRDNPDHLRQATDGPAYALEGRVRLDGDRLRLGIRLMKRSDASVVWANNYDESLETHKIIDLQEKAAAAVATAVAQPYGVVFQANATQFTQFVPDDWKAYACTLAYYGYRSDLNPQTHASVQECLEQATREFPNYATAWALLSMTYVDELRFRYRLDRTSPVSLERAIEAAVRAVELDPQDVRALQAQMLTLYFRGEFDAALAVGARAFAINPNDTELAGEYGFRLALSGQWRVGCAYLSQTVTRNPGPVGYFEAALAVCSYIEGDYADAERWARLADLRANPIYRVILLAILGKLGKTDQAHEERKWLEANVPGFLDNIRKEVALRIRRPEDQQHFIEGLREAGVSVPSN
ncbi:MULTISPECIES: hypothetical protein [Sinorhizobium]|uniref:hypothetical protein n=1 Tax=Sinorhizobium TaxID=28105 RepID=UPI000BE9259B|nr:MULTISPECIES: hypothetical protein [Sinorhizobium]PDT51370.1 hypothetical protein CO664_21670 [Sinorhizobium sp. NG07B]POH26021.1 hypothetical protein ATY30_26080 [Sinorhizobium americanum]